MSPRPIRPRRAPMSPASSGCCCVGGEGRTCAASPSLFRPCRRSRSRTRMCTTTTIDCLRCRRQPGIIGNRISPTNFNESAAGTGDQSCSAREEAQAFNKALLAEAYELMQARWRTLHQWGARGTVAPCAFVPVDANSLLPSLSGQDYIES